MTREQIGAEKVALQKALLYYESIHGRPVSHLLPHTPPVRTVHLISCQTFGLKRRGSCLLAQLDPDCKSRGMMSRAISLPSVCLVAETEAMAAYLVLGFQTLLEMNCAISSVLVLLYMRKCSCSLCHLHPSSHCVVNDLPALKSCCRPDWVSCHFGLCSCRSQLVCEETQGDRRRLILC